MLGLASYGRAFTLANVNKPGINSPKDGKGPKGPITGEHGFLAYYEICSMGLTFVTYEKSVALAPYGHKGKVWVGYDTVRSLQYKLNELVFKKSK